MSDGGLRRLFRKHLPFVQWTTIESRLTQSGIPDIHGCYDGVDFWVEMKVARGWKVRMRPFQIGWLHRRAKAGGLCWIAVRKGKALHLIAGAKAGALAQTDLLECPGVMWDGGPRNWKWNAVLKTLQGIYGKKATRQSKKIDERCDDRCDYQGISATSFRKIPGGSRRRKRKIARKSNTTTILRRMSRSA
jgi:hypothetical protein